MPFIEPRTGTIEGAGDAWESFTNYLPGYARARERQRQMLDDQGLTPHEIVMAQAQEMNRNLLRLPDTSNPADMLTLAPLALGAGPRPGALGRAPEVVTGPREPNTITGGGSRNDPQIAPNSSMELGSRPGMETVGDVRIRYADPPRRERRSFANDNVEGPVSVQTKGGSRQDMPIYSHPAIHPLVMRMRGYGSTNVEIATAIKERTGAPVTPGQVQAYLRRHSPDEGGGPALGAISAPALAASVGADFSPTPSVAHPALLWAAFRERFVDDGWGATVTPEPDESAGRFAAPIFNPNREMIENTRELTSRVGRAAADLESEFNLDPPGVTTVAKTPRPRSQERVSENAIY